MKREMSVVGIDLAKRTFHVVGMDATGQILCRKRLARNALMPFIAQLPPVMIGLEACGGAHYWARRFREHGHTVKLMAPQFVKPYVKANKNDTRDAEAIGQALTRPTMRFVPVKGLAQQDLQSLHRARERLMKARTALVNEIRGLLSEYGIVLPTSVRKFRKAFVAKLEAERTKLTELSHELFAHLFDEFLEVEKRLVYYDEKLTTLGQSHPECQRWYRRTVTRCARLAAEVGWPEPAMVVISIESLTNAIALACTDASKAIWCLLPFGSECLQGGFVSTGCRRASLHHADRRSGTHPRAKAMPVPEPLQGSPGLARKAKPCNPITAGALPHRPLIWREALSL